MPESTEASNGWTLTYDRFEPEKERLREALCTTGNGFFATRGAAPDAGADSIHYPGTYVGGLFNRVESTVSDHRLEHESMVNVPNWLPLRFRIEDGEWFRTASAEILDYRQELDLRRGVLARRIRFRDEAGRHTGISERRFVSMADRDLAALEIAIQAEDWSGEIEIESAIDGAVTNSGVERYLALESRHLEDVDAGAASDEVIALTARTSQSRVEVALAARTRIALVREAIEEPVALEVREGERTIAHAARLSLEPGEVVSAQKIVSLHTSRDEAIDEPTGASIRSVERAAGFDALLEQHVIRWDHLWGRLDHEISGEDHLPLPLRVHLFHIAQTASEHSVGRDVAVPARGLHGEAYRGHIFWDELFVLRPLALKLPAVVRSLLAYRHRRLPEARHAAAEAGHAGAMYPWQSGSDGREESQMLHLNPRTGKWKPDRSHRQRHIGLAIAYTNWKYFQATGDIETLSAIGAEQIIEVARFFASLAELDPVRGRYVIRGVMGPDEYHDGYPDREEGGLDNNAYTNVLAAWVIGRALEVFERLPEERCTELVERLGIDRAELDLLEHVSRRMYVHFLPAPDERVIAQFEGYEDLEELDWEAYRERYGDIHRLDRILDAEGDTPNRYKVSKQADVLMLLYLLSKDELRGVFDRLGYELTDEAVDATVDYYLPRTAHGSTLSRVVHSWVLARMRDDEAWQLFCEALAADLADVQGGTTAEGVHLGAMAGTVDIVQRVFLGIDPHADVLWLDPYPPAELDSIETRIHYRGHAGILVRLEDSRRLVVSLPPSDLDPITIGHAGELHELWPGHTFEVRID